MAFNLVKTARAGKAVDGEAEVTITIDSTPRPKWGEIVFGKPVILVTAVLVSLGLMAVVNTEASLFLAAVVVFIGILGTIALRLSREDGKPAWHRLLEGRALIFTVLTIIAVLIGGVAELVPALVVSQAVMAIDGPP